MAVVVALLLGEPAAAFPQAQGEGEGLSLSGRAKYPFAWDVALIDRGGRSYAIATSAPLASGGDGYLRAFDVGDPSRPRMIGALRCRGDFLWVIPAAGGRLIVTVAPAGGPCLGASEESFVVIDADKPDRLRVLGSAPLPAFAPSSLPRTPFILAGLTQAAHPELPFFYSGRATGDSTGEITVWSIKKPGPPEPVASVATGGQPYDLALSADGSRLAAAMGSNFAVYDTSEPGDPQPLFVHQCPGCSLVNVVSFTTAGGLIVSDASAATGSTLGGCPTGALYFYTLAGTPDPLLVGAYHPSRIEQDPSDAPFPRPCWTTEIDVSEDSTRAVLSWSGNGLRYVDISEVAGLSVAEADVGSVRELGWFRADQSGFHQVARFQKGSMIFSADYNRGLDVYNPKIP